VSPFRIKIAFVGMTASVWRLGAGGVIPLVYEALHFKYTNIIYDEILKTRLR
jgi:hypothetical protein